MKAKYVGPHSPLSGASEIGHMHRLLVTLTKGEKLNHEAFHWMTKSCESVTILNEVVSLYDQRHLLYNVRDLISLNKKLSGRVSGRFIWHVLLDLGNAIETLSLNQLDYRCALYSPHYVLLKAGRLCLTFLPIDGMELGPQNSPITMLKQLCKADVGGDSPSTLLLQELIGFVNSTHGVFDYTAFREFLFRNESQWGTGRGDITESIPGRIALRTRHTQVPQTVVTNVTWDSEPNAYVLRRLSDNTVFIIRDNSNLTIGRSTTCDICLLGSPKLSRIHAMITRESDSVYVLDLGSVNGTWVNGNRLATSSNQLLRPGDNIDFADIRFQFDGPTKNAGNVEH